MNAPINKAGRRCLLLLALAISLGACTAHAGDNRPEKLASVQPAIQSESSTTVYWPDSTSGCRVDLTTATKRQIVGAVYCLNPRGGVDTNIPLANEIWQKAGGLR